MVKAFCVKVFRGVLQELLDRKAHQIGIYKKSFPLMFICIEFKLQSYHSLLSRALFHHEKTVCVDCVMMSFRGRCHGVIISCLSFRRWRSEHSVWGVRAG